MLERKLTITEKNNNLRADTLFTFKNFSRNFVRLHSVYFKKDKNGIWQKKSGKTKVKTEEHWKIKFDNSSDFVTSSKIIPWKHKLKVLKQSASWICIEKPIGISVHPSVSEKSNQTVVNALVHQFSRENLSHPISTKNCTKESKVIRPGIVHRLDKVTSGILLIAKNNLSHFYFTKNWSQVKKTYLAIVEGLPPAKGSVSAGIIRSSKNRVKMTVSADQKAKDALTFFSRKKINSKKNLSLLEIKIPTGRTHQIRVHLSAIGFPILGDSKYGGKENSRVFLHAHSLVFPDPDQKGKLITVKSEIPSEFEGIMEK